jgi:hypothetical protein
LESLSEYLVSFTELVRPLIISDFKGTIALIQHVYSVLFPPETLPQAAADAEEG